MEHPLVEFRTSHHLSQDDVANFCGITRQIILLCEQGIYPEIPPAILKGVKDEFGQLATYDWPEKHTAWIKQELDKVDIRPLVGDFGIMTQTGKLSVHSFIEWRNLISTSVSNFGKLIKIQPVTIRKYESGATNNLPIQLVERLRHWGFSEAYIDSVSRLPIGNGDLMK